jgi:hypothetical protein
MLTGKHYQHLQSEGFSPNHINQLQRWGVRSIAFAEAQSMGIYREVFSPKSIAGLWLPFTTETYGQIRTDRGIKYLSPRNSKSAPWLPPNDIPIAFTEGYKDAAIATLLGGVPTGAIAGVSHYKTLPPGQGQTIVFDADAYGNHQVFTDLAKAALWTGGRIAIVPPEYGSKAGLCEFLRGRSDPQNVYQEFLGGAIECKEFLWDLPRHWQKLEEEKRLELLKYLVRFYRQSFSPEISDFLEYLREFASLQVLRSFLIEPPSAPRKILAAGETVSLADCLCRASQELLARGADSCKAPSGFKLAVDILGAAAKLLDMRVHYREDPLELFSVYGYKSGLKNSEINSIWRSANKQRREPSMPIEMFERVVARNIRS